jgi:predicted peptidase
MMTTARRIGALALILACSACSTLDTALPASEAPATTEDHMTTGFLFESVKVDGTDFGYAVYVPRGYTPDRKWPVIVFLNGRGECGMDGQKQVAVGLGTAVLAERDAWPFIIVFPQKPAADTNWVDHEKLVMATLDATTSSYSTDAARVYLTGLSQGGRGTWEIAAKHPDRFAAIAPVCGFGDPASIAPKVKGIPVWAFHGQKDDVVPPKSTTDIIDALKALGADATATLYPNANHNSWDQAYRTEKLGEWFLAHVKGR